MQGQEPGSQPTPRTWKPQTTAAASNAKSKIDQPTLVPSLSPAFGKALSGGLVVEGKAAYRKLPIAIECRAKLDDAKAFNILVACDPKSSSQHWELYTHAGSGFLSVYMPGRGGDFKSNVNVCDGKWHDLVANRGTWKGCSLYVDGKLGAGGKDRYEAG